MSNSLKKFTDILYDEDAYTWYRDKIKGSFFSEPVKDVIKRIEGNDSEMGSLLSLHEAIDNKVYWVGNNTKPIYRNFLIEYDDISIEDQIKLIKDIELPYSTAVFSGGKSIHYVISLENALTYDEYFEIFKKLSFSINADIQNGTKVKGVRVPNTYRNGVEQKLVDIRGRINNDEFLSWLNSPYISGGNILKEIHHIKREVQKSDRDEVGRRLKYYIENILGEKYEDANFKCPICGDWDEDCDNMGVTASTHCFNCWSRGIDHNPKIYNYLMGLKIDENDKQEL